MSNRTNQDGLASPKGKRVLQRAGDNAKGGAPGRAG